MAAKDLVNKINDQKDLRFENQGFRPLIEVWPGEDDFDMWVASKESRSRAVICSTPEYMDTPFCGSGSH